MFFRKRTRVKEFLEGQVRGLLTDDGVFLLTGFLDEYQELATSLTNTQGSGEKEQDAISPEDRDLFMSRFIGTFLWLIKYRTLSNLLNSPRKMAYLDLNFDIAAPEVVDNLLENYNTELIKETYDVVDIGCKKAYTGELQKKEEPRFLVSPIWARNPDPHPFRVAARLFVGTVGHGTRPEMSEKPDQDKLGEALEKRFMSMTQKTADAAKGVNLI